MDYKSKKTMCSKCGVRPRRNGQGYCADCCRDAVSIARDTERIFVRMMIAALEARGFDVKKMRSQARERVLAKRGIAGARMVPSELTGARVWQ
ncbi:hypothetical protein GOB94_13935 [Granulicella sp. 5B5]|uniref:hypothetical protein n=1 Tax=Granulicella sp. 5B5 TaxID=1617967 RepID=UPI0015F6A3E7|nr:hypothetical protein [Granulicella sp. 5B5]QMV19667.1 hypothetical protein GOB94_13935 [Granulicella sp. 5B5]